jgi:gamma-glutamyltranspeptidase/glutathione hydrolase
MKKSFSALAIALLVLGCPSLRADTAAPAQPEAASGLRAKPGWVAQKFAVAAANPLATEAGYQMLKAGGSAVDAAIAVQMVLTLVEPQSSGIGGGAFLLHYNGQEVEAFDGRETAPAGVTERLFMGADHKPLAFHEAAIGGRAVGTPGAVRMLELAHQQHGKLPWRRLFEPAIALAEGGFQVSARMSTLLATEVHLKKDAVAAAYFYDSQGQPWPEGHRLKNPELAAVLRRMATEGARALHEGDVAQAIVDKVQAHPSNPGSLSRADLAAYQAKKRPPLCFDYTVSASFASSANHKGYRICGMPPPSSGAVVIGQILGLLKHTPAASLQPVVTASSVTPQADWLHLYTEAARLAFADRAQYIADPDFVQAPAGNWLSLLAPAYLAQRSQRIETGPDAMRMDSAPAGMPGGRQSRYAPMPAQPEYGTSHISIVDAHGNALAMTTSIETAWGARQMVNRGQGLTGGFLLNNELTDFSFLPATASGVPIANRVQPGKRPRSSMSPTLVFERPSGRFVLSTGSPGGAYIPHFTAKTLYGVLNWGLDAQTAINLPNFATFSGPILLEENRFPRATVQALQDRGHETSESALPSGLQAIQTLPGGGLLGGADPRREGLVMGD